MNMLDTLIATCSDPPSGPEPMDTVREIVAGYDLAGLAETVQARPEPWFFSVGPSLTVFATASRPASGSAPHDHGLWAVIACLAGREGSRRYDVAAGRLVETGIGEIHTGEVHALPAEAVHAVFNCWVEPNLVLHLYGGDFLGAPKRVWDPVTGACFALGLAEPLVPAESEQ